LSPMYRYTPMSDEIDIINGCKKQVPRYQRALYDKFASKMLGVCLRYSHDQEEAEDMLQEGFVKVFSHINDYRGDGSFEGWIRRVMINSAINYFVKNKRHYFQDDVDDLGEVIEDNRVHYDQLHVKDLLRVIQALPDGYRTVFNLYEIEGYQHEEIAEMLGISVSTSKTQLLHSKRLLQKRLADYSREIKGY
ncbi:MAG TPA: sigma-70 family RNA polymerase sigma factor, partial [Bacteroidales bacterium]|nr:sigma-70 family RNA polymerase sigma factor [Bacteroidales bacterium]